MKSYISSRFPLETRTTDQIFAFRSAERLIVSNGSQSRPFVLRRRRPPIALNSPQAFFVRAARPQKTASLTLPKVEHGRCSHPTMRLNTFKDESPAKLAQGARLAEDRRVADFPPPMGY